MAGGNAFSRLMKQTRFFFWAKKKQCNCSGSNPFPGTKSSCKYVDGGKVFGFCSLKADLLKTITFTISELRLFIESRKCLDTKNQL
jgi:hypothetical protein